MYTTLRQKNDRWQLVMLIGLFYLVMHDISQLCELNHQSSAQSGAQQKMLTELQWTL